MAGSSTFAVPSAPTAQCLFSVGVANRDQVLSARRRRRIKSMNAATSEHVGVVAVEEPQRSESDTSLFLLEDRPLPRQVRIAASRHRSISLNGASGLARSVAAAPVNPIDPLSPLSAAPLPTPVAGGAFVVSDPLPVPRSSSRLRQAQNAVEPASSTFSSSPSAAMPSEKREALRQLEIRYQTLVYRAMTSGSNPPVEEPLPESLPEANALLQRYEGNSELMPHRSLKREKKSRSSSLPPNITSTEYVETKRVESLLRNLHLQSQESYDRKLIEAAAELNHSMNGANKNHLMNGDRPANGALRPKSKKRLSARMLDDLEEEEIRNLTNDAHEDIVEGHERCPAPNPISMLVGDTTGILKPSKTNGFMSHITAPAAVAPPVPLAPVNLATVYGSPPQAIAPKFVSFSKQPPAGLMAIPTAIPKLQLNDITNGLNSPRSPDRSKYMHIISPRSAFSPHTPSCSPR